MSLCCNSPVNLGKNHGKLGINSDVVMQKECVETKLRFKISKKVFLMASPIMLRPLKTLTQYLIGLERVGILVLE